MRVRVRVRVRVRARARVRVRVTRGQASGREARRVVLDVAVGAHPADDLVRVRVRLRLSFS